MTTTAGAATPAELEARFCLLAAAGDLDGLTRLYAADAVVSLPRGREAAGHAAIRTAFAEALARGVRWAEPDSIRVIDSGTLAMTSSTSTDGVVGTQVARREPDGGWVWVRDGSHLRGPAVADLLGAA
ncbi:YybH family protein [Humibacillus xanthopallidus]|uniref:Ketosteroid isomerase-like protein n=1 Tax=Humibacillus xanthopallidus TaxID=412689 RepID=A0A543I2M1_9MICO|nr:nuclear transport factor 2 family protein [Humibacillus xanthopallidus]TQM64791.1 ketosteroid isomerase-like protein [Humibacillus xanthopallidus]